MSSVNVHPVRVKTSEGWQEVALTGPQGPAGPAGGIPGEIKLWPGTVLPDQTKYGKWVWADGAIYSAATYPEASANIATQWKTAHGAADPGAGNFRVPDLRGVSPMPLDQMPGGSRANRTTRASAITIAAKTGEEYHTLALTETPSHTHSVTTGGASAGHVHYLGSVHGSIGGWQATAVIRGGDRGSGAYSQVPIGLDYNYMEATADSGTLYNYSSGAHQDHTHSGTSAAQGGGGAHENLPPTVFIPYIVRLDG